MEIKEKISQLSSSASDWLNEQEWFQQLKGKWEELDSQSRMYLKFAFAGALAATFLFTTISFTLSVRSKRNDLALKSELLMMMKNAEAEVRRLRDANSAYNASEGETVAWGPYLETQASSAGIEKANITVSPEKPGNSGELAKEALIDVSLKKVSIRQVVYYAFQLENGPRAVKLRNLEIDTKADPAGYMDAVLHVSAFTLAASK